MAHGYPDWEGNKSGLYLMPEWAAFEGADRTFDSYTAVLAWQTFENHDYVVPAGVTLYICNVAFAVYANLAADADKNQMARVELIDNTAASQLASLGGNGGAGLNFSRPLVIPGPHVFRHRVWSESNHAIRIRVSSYGYER